MKLLEILTSVPGVIALGLTGYVFVVLAAAWVTGRHYLDVNRIRAPARSRDPQVRSSQRRYEGRRRQTSARQSFDRA
jgi:hypothetical protein